MNILGFSVLLSLPFFFSCKAEAKKLAVGDPLPAFSLTDQDGKVWNSGDYLGKKILVIYFYPKDESGVCTKEACAFRDSHAAYADAGAMVIGINHESDASHKSFINNHQLPFTLLSDPDGKIQKLLGVKKKFFLTGRETFVIGLDGKVAYHFEAFTKGKEHSDKAIEFIKSMGKHQ